MLLGPYKLKVGTFGVAYDLAMYVDAWDSNEVGLRL